MKTRSLTNLSLVLTLTTVPLAGGCTQSNATNAEPTLTNVQPAAVTPAGDKSVTAPAETTAAAPSAPRAEPILPPNILPATPLAEVIKLAQSGVDENVMLTFITNSIKPFGLDAEGIVYLNDLGLSGSVITTMMQHDQGLKSKPAQSAAPEPEPVAAAPTYVNPPPATPVAEAQPTYVSNNYFYDSLAPYGNWIEVEGYGRCWRPTIVIANRNWQPYSDRGRWIYTDAGWYWLSDYSWGATTFHYGRWFTHPSWGWCWWPDTVWAPSWVSWRYSGDYCGWAPLPPTACYRPGFGFSYYGSSVGISFGFGIAASWYTFVPLGRICDTRPYHHRLPAHQATQVYNNSTVINNYVSGKNNTVINQGIAPERIHERTRTEVRTVSLRDADAGVVRNGRREQLDHDGRTLVVHRPPLPDQRDRQENIQRSSGSPRTGGTIVNGSPQRSLETRPVRNERGQITTERGRVNPERVTPSTAPTLPAPGATPFPTLTTPRPETGSGRDRKGNEGSPNHSRIEERARGNAPVAVRSPDVPTKLAPAPVRKIDEPRVMQLTPQTLTRPATPAPASSVVVIGGKSSARSGGSDYSVWSTPSPSLPQNAPGNSSRVNNAPPSASRPWDVEGQARSGRKSSESRGSYSTYSAPAPVAVAPAPSGSAPTPSYTPRPSPAPVSVAPPSASRVESRPSPSRSSSPARSESRSESSNEKRGR